MMLLAKAALGIGGTLALAGAYAFHEGIMRVDVDESRPGGSHLHLWLPAAAVPLALHAVPRHHLCEAAGRAREFLPAARAIVKELKKYPDAELVEVKDGEQHVRICTHKGKLQVDVKEPGQTVYLLLPLATLDDITSQLEYSAPGA